MNNEIIEVHLRVLDEFYTTNRNREIKYYGAKNASI